MGSPNFRYVYFYARVDREIFKRVFRFVCFRDLIDSFVDEFRIVDVLAFVCGARLTSTAEVSVATKMIAAATMSAVSKMTHSI